MIAVIDLVARLGRMAIGGVRHAGSMGLFAVRLAWALFPTWTRPRDIVQQVYAAGVLSLVIILVAGGFVGLVLGLQGYNILNKFNANESLGVMVALSLVRELGPVVAALLFAGRAGSAITAEIALMKTTEQLAALEMMAVDPMRRVIGPRFWGALISVPLLASLFSMVGIIGGYLIGVVVLGVDPSSFWGQIAEQMDPWEDVGGGALKSLAFGAVIALIAVYEGYEAEPTASGMARATTQTVVLSSLAVLGLDFVMTAFMFGA
ncbi:lipid asymmetry maintenance ABC transporter permease subunit MlaE [Guyparkeria sp.]|uniref:lipid asymmetry maintenance ABC transporter permease subunit MlaE n=1 Tax=Guyparkeria sp. TaxID=2035736 RepID=UPI0035662259